jgi:hypothetical protein
MMKIIYLTNDYVSIMDNKFSFSGEENGMRAYVNSTSGRAQLKSECSADIVQRVEVMWGTTPTVTEPASVAPTLDEAKQSKLTELSIACQNAIYAGVDASDTKGTEHFSLTIEDQTNLSALADAVAQGAASVPYHADGQLCREFATDEYNTVYTAAKAFITRQTTFCNHLNVWVRRCTTVDEVNAITYASALPDDLLANYNTILGITTAATAQNTADTGGTGSNTAEGAA